MWTYIEGSIIDKMLVFIYYDFKNMDNYFLSSHIKQSDMISNTIVPEAGFSYTNRTLNHDQFYVSPVQIIWILILSLL